MARGTQFLDIVQRVRDETGRANSVAVGVEDIFGLKTAINRVYTTLYMAYDWPHLREVFPKKTLNPGERFYDFDTNLNVERVEEVKVWFNGQAYGIERGINVEDYNLYDPDADARSDPALKWDVRYVESAGKEQIEIWPIPATTQQVQFIGIRTIPRLVADADKCLLDDDLVVLFTAAPIVKRQKQQDGEDMLAAAQAHFAKLTKRMKAGTKICQLGLGDAGPAKNRTFPVTIRVAGT